LLFSEVNGHEKIKAALTQGIKSNRVGHAYIFEGKKGIGKLSVAKAFAQALLCENYGENDSCGVCKNCSQVKSDNHPDVIVVTNQLYDINKKSMDVSVDTVRSMKQDVYIRPYSADRKIYIIPRADTMNVYAQNSLLKVLEEPPEYCTIILLAENSSSFLPTILSRTIILRFYQLQCSEVRCWLKNNYEDVLEEKINVIAKLSGGSIGKAKELLENEEIEQLRNEILEHIFALSNNKRKDIYDFSYFLRSNKNDIDFLFDVMQTVFRDLMYLKQFGSDNQITNSDKKVKLEKLSDYVTLQNVSRLLEILLKYKDYLFKNIGIGIVSQCLGLELWEAINDRGYRSKI
jgi:DNA polymerase-3 subunit delta'